MNYVDITPYYTYPSGGTKKYGPTVQGGKLIKPYKYMSKPSIAYPVNNTRITFDMHVRSSESNLKLFEECPLVPITDKVVILEVKYNGDLTDYVSRMIKAFEIDQVAISKYCESRKIFMDFNF